MGVISHSETVEANSDTAKCYTEKLIFQIYEHFDGQNLIDVTFKLSNPNALVPAHRLILSSASPYFKELFKTDKGICPQIEIDEIDSVTFERLIIFCYTGKTLITIDNVDKILKAAIKLRLESAVSCCAHFIIEHISVYTLQRAYVLQSEAHCELLNEKIFEYELKNFMNIMQSAEFLNFAPNKLHQLLESNDLNMESEKGVFGAIKRWYEHDAFVRKQHLPELIASLRLTQFETDFIVTNIQSLPGCRSLALEAISWITCPIDRSNLKLKYTKPREVQEQLLMAFCLEAEGYERGAIFQYNKAADAWHKWIDIEIPIDFMTFKTIFIDENLTFIGGTRKGDIINEVSSWNLRSKTFKQLPAMNMSRSSPGVVVLNEEIYAIGGEGNSGILQSVEKYSVSNGWKLMRSMDAPRYSPSVVALNGKIYVMGGYNDAVLKSVECYDPLTNSWAQCADMNEGHEEPGALVFNGHIFIVGGTSEADHKTVERYDPQRNEWTKICSLNAGRWKSGCISMDNQLWAIGGIYTNDVYKDHVSVYDEQNDRWMEKAPIPLAGAYYCFMILKCLYA
ncbi:kelch-like protein 5 [Eurosta solidaginis]|uniref:kelch-like protein 5 n=1 Tax=Eurosta solidaginis TaxID=178769 RepID=UPI0035313414